MAGSRAKHQPIQHEETFGGGGDETQSHGVLQYAPFQSLFSLNSEEETKRHFIVDSSWFNGLITGTVILNTIQLGVEADHRNLVSVWEVCENVVTGIFFLEMIIKIVILKSEYFQDKSNWLDALLTMMGVVDCWILGILMGDIIDLQSVSALRALRLVRLVRVVKVARSVRPLMLVLSGLYHALMTTFWVFLVLIMVMYVFAVFCTEYIGHGDVSLYPAYSTDEAIIDTQDALSGFNPHLMFGSMAASMLTLFNIAIGGEWQEVVRPLAIKQPWLVFLFLSYCVVIVFGIMNVIIAIVVDNVIIESKKIDAEELNRFRAARRDLLENIQVIIASTDENGDGSIDAKELKKAFHLKPELQEMLKSSNLPGGWTAHELLNMLDNDGNGVLQIDEMTTNLFRLLDGDDFQRMCIMQGSLNQTKWLVRQAHKKLEIHMAEVREAIRVIQLSTRVARSMIDDSPIEADTELDDPSSGEESTGVETTAQRSTVHPDQNSTPESTVIKPGLSRWQQLKTIQPVQRASWWNPHEAGKKVEQPSAATTDVQQDQFDDAAFEDPADGFKIWPRGAGEDAAWQEIGQGLGQDLGQDIKRLSSRISKDVFDACALALKSAFEKELGFQVKDSTGEDMSTIPRMSIAAEAAAIEVTAGCLKTSHWKKRLLTKKRRPSILSLDDRNKKTRPSVPPLGGISSREPSMEQTLSREALAALGKDHMREIRELRTSNEELRKQMSNQVHHFLEEPIVLGRKMFDDYATVQKSEAVCKVHNANDIGEEGSPFRSMSRSVSPTKIKNGPGSSGAHSPREFGQDSSSTPRDPKAMVFYGVVE